MDIITIETKALGDRSYVLIDGDVAAVIDPQRDIDRIEAVLAERNVRLTHVFETHIHNDYVTGGIELATRADADYVVSAADDVTFQRTGAVPGDQFHVGEVTVTVVATPGHTPTHLSYIASHSGEPFAAFVWDVQHPAFRALNLPIVPHASHANPNLSVFAAPRIGHAKSE